MAYQAPLNGGRINASIVGNNTAGVLSAISTGTMYLSGGNNVTLGQNGGTVSIAGPSFTNSNGFSFGTNGSLISASYTGSMIQAAAANASTLTNGTLQFANSNSISFGWTNGSLSASYGGGPGGLAVSASGSSANLTGLTFTSSGAGNVNFGMAGSAITGSYSQTLQTSNLIQGIVARGTGANSTTATSLTSGSLSFSNGGNINFGLTGGTITASYTGALGGANTFGISGGNSSGNVGTISGPALSMIFNGGNNITLSQSLTNGSQATITINGPAFSNSNGFVFGTTNSSQITMNYTGAQIQAAMASGSTLTGGTLSFANSNNITFGMSSNSITASYGGALQISGQGTAISSGTAILSANSGPITISASSNVVNFGVPAVSSLYGGAGVVISTNGSNISIIGPGQSVQTQGIQGIGISSVSSNSTTASTATNGSVVFSNNTAVGGLGFGMNGNTITGSAVLAPTLYRWEYPNNNAAIGPYSSAFSSNNRISFQHVYMPHNLIATVGRIAGAFSFTAGTVTNNQSMTYALSMGVYSLNGSSLSLISSAALNNSFVISGSTRSTAMTSVTVGPKVLSVTFASPMTLTAGEYWIAAMMSTSQNITSNTLSFYQYGNVAPFGISGAGTAGTAASMMIFNSIGTSGTGNARDGFLLQGVHSTTTAAMPTTIVGSQINNYSAGFVQSAGFFHQFASSNY